MIVDFLNRCSRSSDFRKAKLYDFYQDKRTFVKQSGYDIKIKRSFDLYTFQVLYRHCQNERAINEAIYLLQNQNEDVLRHLNYQERQRFYCQEISKIVANLVAVSYDENVYLPCYNRQINHNLLADYEALSLKKYQLLLKDEKRSWLDMIDWYGLDPYIFDFCDLECLVGNESKAAFYSQELDIIYFVEKNDFTICELVLKDKWFKGDFTKPQIMTLAKMIMAGQEDILIYDYLVQENLLSAKFMKKMEKKWRQAKK